MQELRLSRTDFELEWYDAGAASAGQGTACRVVHIDSGLEARSALHSDRNTNRRDALEIMALKILAAQRDRTRPARVVLEAAPGEAIEAVRHASGPSSKVDARRT